jgi:Lrp/AsnC family transcriptional regulator
MIDDRDRKILSLLQDNADFPVHDLAAIVNLSVSACWRRIKRLEDERYIAKRTVHLDRRKMRLPTTVYVFVRTANHSLQWLEDFRKIVADIPEIVESHRLTGDVDYLLKVVLPNVEHWDVIYKRLVSKLQFNDISSYISMEEIKSVTSLPTSYI